MTLPLDENGFLDYRYLTDFEFERARRLRQDMNPGQRSETDPDASLRSYFRGLDKAQLEDEYLSQMEEMDRRNRGSWGYFALNKPYATALKYALVRDSCYP